MTAPRIFAEHAPSLAAAGWEVGPLNGKIPAIPNAHGPAGPGHAKCKGECGRWGHGCLDFSSDAARVVELARRYPTSNIGGRPPQGILVVDTDPRHGGEDNLHRLAAGRTVPTTMVVFSGRGDGGRHRYYRHPGGKVSAKRLPAGIDLKGHAGYVVLPPSIHPDTGRPYRWAEPLEPIVELPRWLADLIRPEVETIKPTRRARGVYVGESIVEWFNDYTTWEQILTPHGWRTLNADGTAWLHPTATSAVSATVSGDSLYVYSPNTPFEVTEAMSPRGYSRFAAWAVLEHHGDLSAAAKAARTERGVAA